MATDFTYGGKQIVSGGPFKPGGKDMPNDARTRVDCYADIATIPNPYVGLKITVKVDETNNNKMTDYIVKSLKANSLGIANSLIDEVVRYVDYLGVNTSGSSGEGLTTEQAQQLQTAYEHSQSTHVQASNIPTKVSQLENDNNYATNVEVINLINSIESIPSGNITLRDVISGEVFSISNVTSSSVPNIILSTTSLSFNENSNSSFTVKLDSQPESNITVNVSVNNGNVTVDKSSLTFTSSNYSVSQTIIVNGVHDSSSYINKSSVITLSASGINSRSINVNLINIDEEPVETVNVESVLLDKSILSVEVNKSYKLTANILPTNATNKNVTWSVNNENVSVENGLVRGLIEGESIVTVTTEDGNKTATCTVTVTQAETADYTTDSLAFYLDASDKEQNSKDTTITDKIKNIACTLNNVDFDENSGWQGDSLLLKPTSTVVIPKTSFDFSNGYSIEFNQYGAENIILGNTTNHNLKLTSNNTVSIFQINYRYLNSDNTEKAGSYQYDTFGSTTYSKLVSADNSKLNSWVVTFGDTIQAYFNGVKTNKNFSCPTDFASWINDFNSDTVSINRQLGTKTNSFKFVSLRIYEKVLTQEEITKNYNSVTNKLEV